MQKLIELKEYDSITSEKCDLRKYGKYRLPEKDFNNLESFIHSFQNSAEADIMDFVNISYKKRDIGTMISLKNYVGLIQFKNDMQLQVLPKITFSDNSCDDTANTKRVFLKMIGSMKDFQSKVFTDSRLDVNRMSIYEVFIRMYLQETNELIKHGIKSDYIIHEDNLRFYKGKLLMNKHLKENACHKERFYVSYDEYSINRPENRIIKTTLIMLSKITSSIENSKEIKRLLGFFDLIDTSANPEKDFSEIKIDRNTKHYENLMKWSKVFLLNKSFTTFSGENNSKALLFPMEKVFESYVAKYVNKVFTASGWIVSTQHTGHYLFTHLNRQESPNFSLRPDIVVTRDTSTIIMDTKWKRLTNKPRDNYGISQSDMYQMYAYGKKYETNHIWLLYPITEEFEAGKILSFESFGDVCVKVFFVDVSRIENSIESLKSFIDTME